MTPGYSGEQARRQQAGKLGLWGGIGVAVLTTAVVGAARWTVINAMDQYATAAEVRAIVYRRSMDSAEIVYRLKLYDTHLGVIDSLLHCVRMTQLHKPECE